MNDIFHDVLRLSKTRVIVSSLGEFDSYRLSRENLAIEAAKINIGHPKKTITYLALYV